MAYFGSLGEHYKAEIIESIPTNEDVSLYREGKFEDLCAARMCPARASSSTSLMKVAGAYWRGDHRNEMLQRVYGTAWTSKDDLQKYLTMLEEAEKRDHRKLGRELDLFHIDEHAQAWCSGTPRAGRCGRSRAIHAPRVPRQRLPGGQGVRRSSTRRCGEDRATGTSTARTCSRRNRRSATTRSSR